MFFNNAPIAKKLHPKAIAGLSTDRTEYKPFKKYLLFYVCYLFGAYFQQCKRHNIQFKFEKDFLMIQLINFRKMIEKFYNKPNKKTTIWMPLFDNLFGKKDLNSNKKTLVEKIGKKEALDFCRDLAEDSTSKNNIFGSDKYIFKEMIFSLIKRTY